MIEAIYLTLLSIPVLASSLYACSDMRARYEHGEPGISFVTYWSRIAFNRIVFLVGLAAWMIIAIHIWERHSR